MFSAEVDEISRIAGIGSMLMLRIACGVPHKAQIVYVHSSST